MGAAYKIRLRHGPTNGDNKNDEFRALWNELCEQAVISIDTKILHTWVLENF